ncbi:hypothetical protein ACFP1Z_10095 [Streptomyces gamaensis]|uniref:Proteinase inhibitor I42 chagasin domain-containing protein n=1 Tax=Streptomyces gamaensis TaxID=1763542 RepID=A0ABW0YYL3_9ACTN
MKTVRILTVPVAAGLALSAATAPAPAATAAPEHRPAVSSTLLLTNADDNRTVNIDTNDVIRVHLDAIRGEHETWVWDVPAAASPEVLSQSSGSTSPTGDAEASFRAVGKGTTEITAHRRCVANPGYVCPQTVIPWKVASAIH